MFRNLPDRLARWLDSLRRITEMHPGVLAVSARPADRPPMALADEQLDARPEHPATIPGADARRTRRRRACATRRNPQ